MNASTSFADSIMIPAAPIAVIRCWRDLIDACRIAKALRSLSNEYCDARGGLTRGHTDKVLGPSGIKNLTMMTFDTYAELFAVEFHMVTNPEAVARMQDRWEGRDESNVRIDMGRISKKLIERVRPHVLAELGREGAAARWGKNKRTKRNAR